MSEAEQPGTTVPPKLQAPHQEHVWRILRQVWDRMNAKDEHFVMPIVGREGIGKSQTALKIGSMLDKQFTHENVLFRAEEFLKILRDEEYYQGAIYVLDEAGVSFGKRSWQDSAQVKANQAMQLIRDHNVGLIFTLPRLSELDSQTQGRAHAFYEIVEKVDGDHVVGKWKWIDPDRSGVTGKIYKKFPRNRSGQPIRRIGFAPPDPEIVEPYNERKREYQQQVYDEAIGELEDDGDDDTSQRPNPQQIANEIVENEGVRRYLKTINNGTQTVLDWKKIRSEYDVGQRRAKEVKSLVLEQVNIDVM